MSIKDIIIRKIDLAIESYDIDEAVEERLDEYDIEDMVHDRIEHMIYEYDYDSALELIVTEALDNASGEIERLIEKSLESFF